MAEGVRALRSPGVWLGVVAAVLLAGTAAHTAQRFDWLHPSWPSFLVWLAGVQSDDRSTLLAGVGVALLVVAWLLIRPGVSRVDPRWAVGLWCLPFVLAPPVLSSDAVPYLDAAWTVWQGIPPYSVGFSETGSPVADLIRPFWQGDIPAYPPLTLLVFAAMAKLAAFHPYWAMVALRIPALIALVIMAALVPRLARVMQVDSRRALWFGLANPLTVVHVAGGLHSDALMVAACLVALWLATIRRTWVSLVAAPVMVGVAMLLKQQGGLVLWAVTLLPIAGELGKLGWGRRIVLVLQRSLVAVPLAVGTFAAVTGLLGWGYGWTKDLSSPARADTMSLSRLAARGVNTVLGLKGDAGAAMVDRFDLIGYGMAGLVIVSLLLWFIDRPLIGVAWSALALVLLGPVCQPWYPVWGLALLALTPLGSWTIEFLIAGVVWLLVGAFLHELPKWPILPSAGVGLIAAAAATVGIGLLRNRAGTTTARQGS